MPTYIPIVLFLLAPLLSTKPFHKTHIVPICFLLTMSDCLSVDRIKAWVTNCPNKRLRLVQGLCETLHC